MSENPPVLCGVCGETEIDIYALENRESYTSVYQGMAITQYVCSECGKLSFNEVWRALKEGPSYIGGRNMDDVLG